jgi:hypothetical protein
VFAIVFLSLWERLGEGEPRTGVVFKLAVTPFVSFPFIDRGI